MYIFNVIYICVISLIVLRFLRNELDFSCNLIYYKFKFYKSLLGIWICIELFCLGNCRSFLVIYLLVGVVYDVNDVIIS